MVEPGGAIGIFDSGVGGLTVARSVMNRLPGQEIVYLGDMARLPYGTKSPDTVIRYARACTRILVKRGVKLLIVACNTASAYALEVLRDDLEVPVVGVVEPGARAAVELSAGSRIGVIGTQGTVASGEYARAIHAYSPDAEVFSKACPLFVPLAEEGWTEGAVPRGAAEEYLNELREKGIDTLLLGCTHYPLLRGVIADAIGPDVAIVDSAECTAEVAAETLDALGENMDGDREVAHRFLVSDSPQSFADLGRRFLGREVLNVEWVDV